MNPDGRPTGAETLDNPGGLDGEAGHSEPGAAVAPTKETRMARSKSKHIRMKNIRMKQFKAKQKRKKAAAKATKAEKK